MKKTLVYIILLFLFLSLTTANSLAFAQTSKNSKVVWKQSDIWIDSDSIAKKQFDSDFKSKYKSSEFVYEYKTPEKNAWDRFKDWLASVFRRIFSFQDTASSIHFVMIFLKTLAFIVIIFVIYMIVKAIMNNEGQWVFGKNSDKKIIHYDEIEKNLLKIDFEKLIQNSLQLGDKRLTIRYYYLWLLKKMSKEQIIVWDVEKTNSDYLYEIKDAMQKDDFAYLSYLYNYIWYGEFELDDETFEKARITFEKSIKKINNE